MVMTNIFKLEKKIIKGGQTIVFTLPETGRRGGEIAVFSIPPGDNFSFTHCQKIFSGSVQHINTQNK
jgi:hypothetical protein